MMHRVTCMVGGRVFNVDCHARNRNEAISVARAQYPNARIMSSNILY